MTARLRKVARKAIAIGFNAGGLGATRVRKLVHALGRGPVKGAASVRVIAHRGASASAPENTVAAFRRAVEQGVREVELDVQLARDDVLIVYHDLDLAQKTGARGRVRDHPSASLRGLDIGSWFDSQHPERAERFAGTRVNVLSDVLETFGDALHYHVEIKSGEEAVAERLLAEIVGRGLRDAVTVTSFLVDPLVRVRALDPEIRICQLILSAELLREQAMDRSLLQDLRSIALHRREIERAGERGFTQVALPAHQLGAALVAFAHARGLSIRAWRVRDLDDLDRVARAGADGATVNWPDRALVRLAALAAGSSS